jgi:hypothetical protein
MFGVAFLYFTETHDMKHLALGVAVLGLSAASALAQTPTTFADVDLDGSGELSFVELQAVWTDLTDAEFTAADADGSGGLTPVELDTLQPSAVPAVPSEPQATVPTDPAMAPAP